VFSQPFNWPLSLAWDVDAAMMDQYGLAEVTSVQVTSTLDEYVRDLSITGTAHTLEELAYRFTSRLGLVVYMECVDA
jgi:hypothetical protein